MKGSSRSQRNHQFDLFRILFATLVLFSHASTAADGDNRREILAIVTRSNITFGILGVYGFFLLSGSLIVQSWRHDPELLNFLRKRALRIVPGYLVAAIVSTIVIGFLVPGVPHFFRHLGGRYVASILLLGSPSTPEVFPGEIMALVNGALWTIPYEFRCYLLVALFGILGFFKRPAIWLGVTVALFALMNAPHVISHITWLKYRMVFGDTDHNIQFAAVFMIGGCFTIFRHRIRFRPWFAAMAAIALIGTDVVSPPHFEAALVSFGAYLLFYIAQTPIRALDWMKNFPDLSYGVYLYGWPVERLWIHYFHGSQWVTFAVAAPICFALGWLSWHFVERPMLKLKRKAIAPLPAP